MSCRGGLVEGRAHGVEPLPLHLVEQAPVILPAQPRRKKARDVLVGAVARVARMDEAVEIAELELDRRAHAMFVHHLRMAADDLQAMLDRALMVVGEIEHEQIAKIETCFHDIPPTGARQPNLESARSE